MNKPPPAVPPGDVNALWRMSLWFPKLSPFMLSQLKAFHGELLKFNLRLNLIARSTERDADEAHFADCVLAAELMLKQDLGAAVCDVGSGNGFPGIVLAIMDPGRQYQLVDSDARKCEFLKHVSAVLGLQNVLVLPVRIETLTTQPLTTAVSRGFASISKTLLGCKGVFAKGARYYHMKGTNWSTEIAELPSQLISIWKPELVGEYVLPVSQARRTVVVTYKIH